VTFSLSPSAPAGSVVLMYKVMCVEFSEVTASKLTCVFYIAVCMATQAYNAMC
jgi:hypothetical protein